MENFLHLIHIKAPFISLILRWTSHLSRKTQFTDMNVRYIDILNRPGYNIKKSRKFLIPSTEFNTKNLDQLVNLGVMLEFLDSFYYITKARLP